MLQHSFSVALIVLFAGTPASAIANHTTSHMPLICAITDTSNPIKQVAKSNANTSWDIFWRNFTTAINAKDKQKVAALTSGDFYDGGGSTVEQWLQSDVYENDKNFTAFKSVLKKGVNSFKGFDGSPYKATGKNKSGDLFFEYKKGKWLFGGIVGD